jgi:hypothetical protein
MNARVASSDPSATKLEGIDNIKAQLYGVAAVLAEKRAASSATDAAAESVGGATGGRD